MESRSPGVRGPRQRDRDQPEKGRLGHRRPPPAHVLWGGPAGLCAHGILGHQDVPGFNGGRCFSEAGDRQHGLK